MLENQFIDPIDAEPTQGTLQIVDDVTASYLSIAIDFQDMIKAFRWGHLCGETAAYNLKYETGFLSDIKSIGLTQLGAGYFSAVFEHVDHPDVVFKFGFRKEDSGAAYAAWCRDKHKQGVDWAIHLPNVLFMDRFESFYVVVMPKLSDFNHWKTVNEVSRFYGAPDYDLAHGLKDAVYAAFDDGGTLDLLSVAEKVDELRAVTIPTFKANAFDALISEWSKPTVQRALTEIYDYFVGVASFDLHDENWMIAENGCIVITDPVSFTQT